MFLNKYDDIGRRIQSAIFQAKLITVPVSVWRSKIGVYEMTAVYIFGLRIVVINTNCEQVGY